MGNMIKNILDSLKLTDEDDFRDDDELYLEAAKEAKKNPVLAKDSSQRSTSSSKTGSKANVSSKDMHTSPIKNEPVRENISKAEYPTRQGRVVPVRSTSKGMEVCVLKPVRFEEATDICDVLLDNRPVIVNLEGMALPLAQRIMDFVSGSVYALNGKIHQVSEYIFIISPDSVDITGDYAEILENGFEVPTFIK